MFENKYGKFITIILVLLIVLIIGVLSYLGYRVIKTFNIESDGKDAVDRFEDQFIGNNNNNDVNELTGNVQSNTQAGDVTPDVAPENDIFTGGSSSGNNTQTYKGFTVVGTIRIPKIDLEYPVLEKASSDAIEVAVGIYSGPGLNKVGNTVIAGHNYRDGSLFSNNKKLSEGDKIYITDTSGTRITYNIYKIYTTTPQDSEYINRDTNGKREISLTTCTDDSNSRLIIWAVEQ